ncbi:hypothetical protein CDAR_618141 [Caerostris darwini]|uniref:Uncharacterized protein n=1 Tax=Caerostris darwini TaxID=1538125 RepID=A0AAV4U9A3_9ARAC|nr:hypothetical protein CDAR_618141 [Caerostris darwini]
MPYIRPPQHISPTPKRRLRFTTNRKNKAEGISNANIDSYPSGTHGIPIYEFALNERDIFDRIRGYSLSDTFQLPQLWCSDNKMTKFVVHGIFTYVCLNLTGIISENIEIGSF